MKYRIMFKMSNGDTYTVDQESDEANPTLFKTMLVTQKWVYAPNADCGFIINMFHVVSMDIYQVKPKTMVVA